MDSPPTRSHTILVVDDELDICLVLQDLLESEGYQVKTVETGTDALNEIQPSHTYSAMILDLGLPDIDGLTVLKRLQDLDSTLPVIILTAHGDQKEKVETLEHRAFAHLIKPYDQRELTATVRSAVTLKDLTIKADQAEQALTSSEAQRRLERQRSQTLLSESEQRLWLALTAGNMGIWDWDISKDQVIWTEDAAKLFGLTPSEFDGTYQAYVECIHPEDRSFVTKAIQAALEDDAPYELEHRIVCPKGEVKWLACKGKVLKNQEGQPYRMVGTVQDISTRKRAELDLRESENKFRQVVEVIREVFWLGNPQKTEILYISPAYEAVWGRTCESLYASPQSWMEAIHPEDQERIRDRAFTKQVTGHYDEEYRICRPDGEVRWIRDRAFPVKNEAGEVYRIVGVAEDITDRKRVQQALCTLSRASTEMTGTTLFQALVFELAATLHVQFAFIAEHTTPQKGRIRAVAFWNGLEFLAPFEYSIAGSPCEQVLIGKQCFWPSNIPQLFPEDQDLIRLGVESYFAQPIRGADRQVVGHVVVMDTKPMERDPFGEPILEFVALRAALEFQRAHLPDIS